MKALIVTLGWRGSMALCSLEPLGKRSMFCTLSPPLHKERAPQSWNMEAASLDAGGLEETG